MWKDGRVVCVAANCDYRFANVAWALVTGSLNLPKNNHWIQDQFVKITRNSFTLEKIIML